MSFSLPRTPTVPVFPQQLRGRRVHRLVQWLPYIGRVLQSPLQALLIMIVPALLLMPLSLHWSLLPFFSCAVAVSFHVDRALSSRFLLPPLALLTIPAFLGLGVGVPMVAGDLGFSISPVHLTMQLVGLLGLPFGMIGYVWARGRVATDWCPPRADSIYREVSKPLLKLAMFFAIFDLIRIVIGWRSGSLDRGYAGEALVGQSIGIWTFTGIFNRWGNLWFFFLPILWRFNGALGRAILAGVLFFYALVAYASGSRGLVLFPIIFIFFGYYFFVDRPHIKVERWAFVLIPLFALYIYTVDVFRNTDQFRNSRLADLPARLAASKAISSGADDRHDFVFTTGRALIGVADEIVYSSTPDEVPYAGGGDILPAMLWTWMPQKLKPNKPLLVDANEVVASYTGVRNERSGTAISLAADCYRRFGWGGIPAGLFAFGVLFGLAVRAVLYVFRRKSVIAGIGLSALLLGGFQAGFSVTVLQTWWVWAYDIPKHVAGILLVAFVAAGSSNRGLDHYARRAQFDNSLSSSGLLAALKEDRSNRERRHGTS